MAQVAATLQYAHANDVTPFMEPVLELCAVVLARERREASIVITPTSARRWGDPAHIRDGGMDSLHPTWTLPRSNSETP